MSLTAEVEIDVNVKFATDHRPSPEGETVRGETVGAPARPDCVCRHRDEFVAVYEAEEGALRAWLHRGTGDASAADDLTAETFARAFGGWESYRGEASRRSWLWHIAKNTLSNWRRSRARDRSVATDDAIEREEAEDAAPHVPLEQRAAVWELLSQVPGDRARTAIYLRYVEGRTTEEVAEALDATPTAVTTLTSRALAGLRERLEDQHV